MRSVYHVLLFLLATVVQVLSPLSRYLKHYYPLELNGSIVSIVDFS